MEFTAQQIADFLQGRVEGNPQSIVNTFAKIEEGRPGALSFLANSHYEHYLYETQSSVVLVNNDLQLQGEVKATLVRVPNAYESVARLLQLRNPCAKACTHWPALPKRLRWPMMPMWGLLPISESKPA